MIRDYNPNNPVVNPGLIKKITEARTNTDDKVFLEFLTALYDAEFLMPVATSGFINSGNKQLFDVMLLQSEIGIYIPIFTNYLEMRKLENTTKNQQSLVTNLYEVTDLMYVLEEIGAEGVVIDPYGINLPLSLNFIQDAEQITQAQKQSKMIKEMHKEILSPEAWN